MRIAWPQILAILVIVVLIFGATRLPDIARNLGKSMRIMKEEVKDLRDDDKSGSASASSTASSGAASSPSESSGTAVSRDSAPPGDDRPSS